MTSDPKRLVAASYDRIAETYARWGLRATDPTKRRYAEAAVALAPQGSRLLDLGCGTGEHVTRLLTDHFDVLGVDGSAESIGLARQRVPAARFQVGDMTTLELPTSDFAVITAFFSIIHVPRDEHRALLGRIHEWLADGGHLVATMGATAEETWADDWLGAPMYWSHWGADDNLAMLDDAGFDVTSAEEVTDGEDDAVFTHLWVVARKRSDAQPVT